MYLKSIEVQGFKSFANKIVFDFHNGITGIVGPNGSGKSNVADAVRWVLGEQRARQLRGGVMQDVIFSGTENRRPLSYASVAITLDNADHQLAAAFDEVTVTRKLYRSGESEYLINGRACRLKDVNELFYDTGIGKEGYSIIGQGQIDQILSGKPEEKRELFDEAAGIVKFKRRKNMSVKKLEEEKQNLLRVTDILAELEKQVGPLEKQSETARLYLKQKETLKQYEINQFLLETAKVKEQLSQLSAQLENVQRELDESGEEYGKTKTEYEAIEEKMNEIDDCIEKTKNKLSETHLLKQHLEGQIALLKEQINSARMSDEHFAKRREAIERELSEKESQKQTHQEELDGIQRELDCQRAAEKEAERALISVQTHIAELEAGAEQWKKEIMELLNSRASTKANIQHFDTMMEQMKVRKAEMNKKLIEVTSGVSVQDELLKQYQKEFDDVSEEIRGYLEEADGKEAQIRTLQSQLAGQNERMREKQTAYHREASRLESLRNMTERYDGYGSSIRRVMEQKEHEEGLIGVVADIIKVDKAYETAIETALGGSIQNIVTDTEETAKRMIGYLKRNKLGRATFLPLTSVNGGQGLRNSEVLKEEGVIGTAGGLVRVEARFRGLADHLLGRTVVVRHIDHGIALARKYKQTLRIVTTDGELISPGGSMTGGAFKNSSSLLSRRREIEELEKTVQRLGVELEEAGKEAARIKEERTSCYETLDEIRRKLQKAYVLQNTVKMKVDQTEAKKQEASATTESIYHEGRILETEFGRLRENQESVRTELEVSERLERELSERIEEQQTVLERERVSESTAMQKAEAVHLTLANYEQKYTFVMENISRIGEEMAKLAKEAESLHTERQQSAGAVKEKEKQIEELCRTIAQSGDLFCEIEKNIQELGREKEELTQKNKAFLNRREELSAHMSELDKESFRLNSRKETLDETLERQIGYMWEEYELTYSHAKELRDDSLNDLAWLVRQIQNLKNEIRGLGAVNVNAIEDYKNVSERYEFMKAQHSDIVESEAALVKVIDELDAAMRVQFAERFQAIAKEFDHVFKQLFGGGKGTLELEEDTDILEAGVRITAQPPGKKLQNMMQLSGGEKALTAISLLFAIQNLKPSPFCLLDEIEAALDDSNVTRFAQYLHKLTKNTQFIVITHRRGTMTAADRLYGITMQEKGVSTLVSVDLLEHDLTK